jgi:hypothetical protein
MDGGLISEKQRGLSAKSTKTGPRVDFKETWGLLCKIPRNIDLRIIFQRVKVWTRSARGEPVGRARSTVDRRWRGPRVPEHGGALTGVRPPAASVHQSSPAGAQKRERSTGSSAQASPELERWRGGRVTTVQNQRRRRSVEARLERGEKRREDGRGAVKSGGGARPFKGVGGALGRGGRGLTPALMALTPLKKGGLRGELRGGGNEGGVVTARRHPRRGAMRRGVAGERWPRG